MDFSLEELKILLEEMGFKNVPDSHLESFAKDLSRLMRHEKHVQKLNQKSCSAPPSNVLVRETVETSSSSQQSSTTGNSIQVNPSRYQHHKNKAHADSPTQTGEPERLRQEQPLKPPARRVKSSEATKKKLKTDPVRLYHWYKTNWEHHGLQ